jgi:hypothetical protein
MLQPLGKLITNMIWLDIVLGTLAGLASMGLYGIGILIPLVLYFVLRDRYPSFARGLAIALFTGLALLLGAFLFCVGMIFFATKR